MQPLILLTITQVFSTTGYDFSTSAISWIQSYLSNRSQRVLFNGSSSNVKHVKCGVPQGSSLGPLLFSIFTNDLPLALNKACVSMYADDSIMYASATTANKVTETLNKELQSVLEWVANNKLVLNISKTKSIVFGTNHSLSARPQLNLVMNDVAVEQVEETKLLGVTLDCKLSCSKHIDSMVVKMGRGLSILKRCSFFDTTLHKQVLQALV